MASLRYNIKWMLKRLFVFLYVALWMYALFNYRSNCVVTAPESLLTSLNIVDGSRTCHMNASDNGLVTLDMYNEPSMEDIAKNNPHVLRGGWFKPESCQPWQKVAIVIPFRDREKHLKILLHRLHPMLKKHQIHYHIFVVEQHGKGTFNRGKVKNIGFLEAMKVDDFDCVIQHDVDLIPEHDGNYYMCDQHARHLCHAIDEMRYHIMYYSIAGGVIAISTHNYRRLNGYSNLYWGWGYEDDDLSARVQESGMLITRPPSSIGRYKMVKHKKDPKTDYWTDRLQNWRVRWPKDGLNDPVGMNYSVISYESKPLYTHITVDVGVPPPDLQAKFEEGPFDGLVWHWKFYLL